MSEVVYNAACLVETDEVPVDASPVRVCVIDLGTNSFHAIIVDAFPNGSFVEVDKIKEMVRLGERGMAEHKLTEKAIKRSMRALRRIKQLAKGWKTDEYLAFATSAIREADNGGRFIERAWDEVGIHVRTISGDLEARLIYQGVRRAVEMNEPMLIVDIGGGSTECIIATSRERLFQTSLKLGAARITEQFITTDPVERAEFETIRTHFRAQLAPVFEAARRHGVREIIGSSGTMENLAQVYLNRYGDASRNIFQQVLDANDVRRVTKDIMLSTKEERKAMAGIDAKRVNQVVSGAILVDVLLKDLPVERLRISPNALREGMVVHFIEQNDERMEHIAPYSNVRRRSVHELAFRCRWEEVHSLHVAALALQLFDVCRPLHGLGAEERELLEYAGILHDIGYHISRSSHHKHGLYLIKHADLRGFQPEEIEIMAYVTRYHRGNQPSAKHVLYDRLPKERKRIINLLAPLLRIAEGLDRSHFQNVTRLHAELTDEALILTLQTKSDPQIDVWGTRRVAGYFEDVYDRKVIVNATVRAEEAVAV